MANVEKGISFISVLIWLTISQVIGKSTTVTVDASLLPTNGEIFELSSNQISRNGIEHAYNEFSTITTPPLLRNGQFIQPPAPDAVIKISQNYIEQSIEFCKTNIDRNTLLEQHLVWQDIKVEQGTPSHGQLIESRMEPEAIKQINNSLIAGTVSLYLANMQCYKQHLKTYECVLHISTFKMTDTSLGKMCQSLISQCPKSVMKSDYRMADGSCNNLDRSAFGKAFTSYRRLLFPNYLDGFQESRRAVSKKELPNPRVASVNLAHDLRETDSKLTLAFMQWSQVVEHDVAHTAFTQMTTVRRPIECCTSDGRILAPRYLHPDCWPIRVPQNDSFYSRKSVTCLNYVRSATAIRSDCTFGPTEQMNQATHFLDASQIYGSSISEAHSLRELSGGRLLAKKVDDQEFLPVSENPLDDCQVESPSYICYKSGDSRVNSHPQLTVMHTLWLREHNRVAKELSRINPNWNDEKLYQEARRIVIAEVQHITYEEWKPLLLGSKQEAKETKQYSKNIDPSVSNSFAAAAMRFVNSMMDDNISLYDKNRAVKGTLRLREYFNRPGIIEQSGNLDALIRGLASQSSQSVDIYHVLDVTRHLFKDGTYGLDAFSLDIHRGRDHGLPGYNSYRKLCGLSYARSFEDFSDNIPDNAILALKTVYEHVDDVDLLVGGLMERHLSEHVPIGHTFSCIISEQMTRTRSADRYFYTHSGQPTSFTKAQLAELRKTSLARIFCDNGNDVDKMQPHVFQQVSDSNKLVSCNDASIPSVSLEPWSK